MATVVVLGAGLGGIPAAYDIRSKLDSTHRVVMVGSSEFYEFTPSNPWVAVGALGRLGVVDVADLLRHAPAHYHRAGELARLHDVAGRAVRHFLLAPLENLRGLAGHGHGEVLLALVLVPVEPVHLGQRDDHAERAWRAYEKFQANPGPVIIGAVQGASCFGPAYEMAMIIDADLRKRRIRDKVPMTFVTSEPYIGHMGLRR